MKIIYKSFWVILLLSWGGSWFLSCNNSFDDGTKNPLPRTEPYPNSKNVNNVDDGDLNAIIDRTADRDRTNWQKPRAVIRSLGNILNKKIADIGAGAGYFSFPLVKSGAEVIAIDIDENALKLIDDQKKRLSEDLQKKLTTRLVTEDDPKLEKAEMDIVFISNTYTYISNRTDYLKIVKEGLKPGGIICIVDFKMKKLPDLFPPAPPAEARLPLYQVENELEAAGFQLLQSDDQTLDYQYIVIAGNVPVE